MGFRNGAYATVWGEVKPTRGNSYQSRIAISKKNRNTGEYEQVFGGFVVFCGSATEPAKSLKERDRIKLLEVDVINRYDKEAGREYVSYFVYSFERAESNFNNNNNTQQTSTAVPGTDITDDDLPF